MKIGQQNLANGMSLNEFAPIANLAPKATNIGIIGIDFNDSSQAAQFEIKSTAGSSKISIKASMGELIRSVTLSEPRFKEERNKLRGMTEHQCTVALRVELCDKKSLQQRIFEVANVANILHTENTNILYFAGQTMNSKSLVLIVAQLNEENTNVTLTVNCEKMVIGSILINEIKDAIKRIH